MQRCIYSGPSERICSRVYFDRELEFIFPGLNFFAGRSYLDGVTTALYHFPGGVALSFTETQTMGHVANVHSETKPINPSASSKVIISGQDESSIGEVEKKILHFFTLAKCTP